PSSHLSHIPPRVVIWGRHSLPIAGYVKAKEILRLSFCFASHTLPSAVPLRFDIRRIMRSKRGIDRRSLVDHSRLIQMWEKGMSVREIAQKNNTSKTTVYRWINRQRRRGYGDKGPHSSRPRWPTWQDQTSRSKPLESK
ncbi:putative homeodomain-like HTH_23 containing protein 3, partial [Homarus americanus]